MRLCIYLDHYEYPFATVCDHYYKSRFKFLKLQLVKLVTNTVNKINRYVPQSDTPANALLKINFRRGLRRGHRLGEVICPLILDYFQTLSGNLPKIIIIETVISRYGAELRQRRHDVYRFPVPPGRFPAIALLITRH